MSRPLPERPNLDHLRHQAKALRDAARAGELAAVARIGRHFPVPAVVALSLAQSVLAREYGFASWPRLKAEVDARALDLPRRVSAFLAASVEGRDREAARLLAGEPRLSAVDIRAAAVLGDADRVRELVAREPALATTPDEHRWWPPLLYVCHSRWHVIDPDRAPGLLAVAQTLLDAGASPDSNNGRPVRTGRYRSALYGAAGIANNPAIAELLLARGANPDDGESLQHSVHHHACLRLLLAHGARVTGTDALAAATRAGDVEGARLLLAAGADPDAPAAEGLSPLRQAVRRGARELAEVLLRHGARDDATEVDRFLGACARADRAAAERALAGRPDLLAELSTVDRGALTVEAVTLVLDLGFPVEGRNDHGETMLHEAAYAGRADVVALLLDRGAEVDARDRTFDGTPLGFATVGSGEHRAGADGDWVGTVRALLAAGAAHDGVWVADSPPSDEVADLLYANGITGPDEPAEPPARPAPDPRVMGELAARLRAAFDSGDLAALGELLHPEARWGGCTNRARVLAWYRSRAAAGVRVGVREVLVEGDAVVLGLSIEGDDGAGDRAGAGYQVFRAEGGAIVDIDGFAARDAALAAASGRHGGEA